MPCCQSNLGVVGTCIGANNIPSSVTQYKNWIRHWLPDGSSVYTFELSAICWAIWNRRNEACFDNKLLRSPTEIITYACALMSYWSGLYGPEMQGKILEGVKTLLSCVHWASAQPRRLRGLNLSPTLDPFALSVSPLFLPPSSSRRRRLERLLFPLYTGNGVILDSTKVSAY